MTNLFKNFKNKRMTESEKQMVFSELKTFISNNPISTPWYKQFGNSIASPFQNEFMLHHKMLATAFVVIILVSATGGTSIAAKYSVPGDILYPVKINLNEKVETFTAISSEAKATVEARHVGERLVEAEQLSNENKLNDKIKTQLEVKFSQDLQSTMTHVDALKTSGDKESAKKVKANIENSLQRHKDTVNELLNYRTVRSNTTVSNPEISPKTMMMSAPVNEQENEPQVSTFSATIQATTTPTNDKDLESDNFRVQATSTISREEDDEETPLLNETLKWINGSDSDEDN